MRVKVWLLSKQWGRTFIFFLYRFESIRLCNALKLPLSTPKRGYPSLVWIQALFPSANPFDPHSICIETVLPYPLDKNITFCIM